MSNEAGAIGNMLILSPFEQLPRDVLHQIWDYVPESVFDIRLTSRLLCSKIDEYAMAPATTQIVEELNFQSIGSTALNLSIGIAKEKSSLFELRMNLRFAVTDLSKAVKRRNDTQNSYNFRFKSLAEYAEMVAILVECIGVNIGKVVLWNCTDSEILSAVSKLLEGMQFKTLEVTTVSFPEQAAKHLLKTIKDHNIHILSLTMCSTDIAEPVNTLLEISSIVKSFRLIDKGTGAVDQWGMPLERIMFGVPESIDWSSIILDMFSRRLDKLQLVNNTSYFGVIGTTILRERLPFVGKKVWLAADCCACRGLIRYKSNKHMVLASPSHLQIRHKSRMGEEWDSPFINCDPMPVFDSIAELFQ